MTPSHDGTRIIALAPNIVEILYAIGQRNQIVGVSQFTTYPPDAAKKPSIGGIYNPNWEQIIALQPDLVIGLNTQKKIGMQLNALGIDFLGVSHERISDIMQSILLIGKACGAEQPAQTLFNQIKSQMDIRRSATDNQTYRVLVCVGHDETWSRIHIAGRHTFYDELIELAGGINVCTENRIKYPEISQENLISMNPDVLIDIRPAQTPSLADSKRLGYNIVTITNNYASIPGPRFILLLNDFARIIHDCHSN